MRAQYRDEPIEGVAEELLADLPPSPNDNAGSVLIDEMDRDALRALLRDHDIPHSNNAGIDRLREQARELTHGPGH